MIEIKYVTSEDKEFWYSLDKHLPEEQFDIKARDRQGYVLFEDGVPKGILRYNLFWDSVPFCTMLYVEWSDHKKGFGSMLMTHWEEEMKQLGCKMIMTSTQVDEDAQHFYRKLGYKDCGGLIMDIPGFEQPMEMFMSKAL